MQDALASGGCSGTARRLAITDGFQQYSTMRVSGMLAIAVGLAAAVTFAACADDATDDGEGAASPTTTMVQLQPGETLPANEPRLWDLSVHCGAAFFSYQINGKWWRTDEGSGAGWMPTEWGDSSSASSVSVVLEINDAGDQLTATHAGRSVVYTPTELTDADRCA